MPCSLRDRGAEPRSSSRNLPQPPLPGRALGSRRAGARAQPVAGVLTSFRSWESFPAALERRIDCSLAGDGFASFPALRCPPYLRPEICERVRAYVCVRLELPGIFHAGHAFPCLQPFPTSRQAAGRQGDLPASEPSSPPASPSSPPRGCPALQQSAEFLSSLISRVLCVCVCVCPCTLCFLSLFFPPSQPALPDG